MMLYQKYSLPESPTSETHRLLCQDKTLAISYFFQRDPICGQIKYFCKESLVICLDPINIHSVFKTFKVSLFTMPCCSSIRDAASSGNRFSIISMHSYGSIVSYICKILHASPSIESKETPYRFQRCFLGEDGWIDGRMAGGSSYENKL